MEITWYGRACFRLKGRDATVITDPCPPSTGFVAGKHDVDILTMSHDHADHTYTRLTEPTDLHTRAFELLNIKLT